MMLFDFNFAIPLNLTLFVIFEGFREFCSLCTKPSHKITVLLLTAMTALCIFFVIFSLLLLVKVSADQK